MNPVFGVAQLLFWNMAVVKTHPHLTLLGLCLISSENPPPSTPKTIICRGISFWTLFSGLPSDSKSEYNFWWVKFGNYKKQATKRLRKRTAGSHQVLMLFCRKVRLLRNQFLFSFLDTSGCGSNLRGRVTQVLVFASIYLGVVLGTLFLG